MSGLPASGMWYDVTSSGSTVSPPNTGLSVGPVWLEGNRQLVSVEKLLPSSEIITPLLMQLSEPGLCSTELRKRTLPLVRA